MGLKLKRTKSEYHSGYGAGSGTIDTTIYYCPCGEGEISYIKDNIPGFKDESWRLGCQKCDEKYHINPLRGGITPRLELTEYHLNFLKKLSQGGSLTHDYLGDEINHLYLEQEKDVEAKRQCEAMENEYYIKKCRDGYEITGKGIEELRKRNLL